MADAHKLIPQEALAESVQPWQMSVEQAREETRQRFRERVDDGEKVGKGSCHDEESQEFRGGATNVVGVRFRDSDRVFFFQTADHTLGAGTWVVVATAQGHEAARVVVAPHQMIMSQLDGDLRPIQRVLSDDDVAGIEHYVKESSRVVKRAGELSGAGNLHIKVVAAEFSLDGSRLKVSFIASDQANICLLENMLQDELHCLVEMQQEGPREEARLLGGLGKCGRTLCSSSWLPMFPDVSIGMVKNQELSLNPAKVSNMVGQLLCCHSCENEQYKQAKAIMPRLGQCVMTAEGEGIVVSLQILKQLVTIRYTDPHREQTYPAAEVFTGAARRARDAARTSEESAAVSLDTEASDGAAQDEVKPERRISSRGARFRGKG